MIKLPEGEIRVDRSEYLVKIPNRGKGRTIVTGSKFEPKGVGIFSISS